MTKNSVPWGEVRAWLLSDPEVRRAYDALEPWHRAEVERIGQQAQGAADLREALEAFRQGLLRHVEVLDGLLGDTAP